MAAEAELGNPAHGRLATQQQSEQPLAVGAERAARMADVSRSTWYRLVSAGQAPTGFTLGRRRVWTVSELRAWLEAGAPPADEWARLRGGPRR